MTRIIPEWLRKRRAEGWPPVKPDTAGGHVFVTQNITGDLASYNTSRAHHDYRETGLLRDIAFNNHAMNDGEHISPFDNGQVRIGDDNIIVELVQGIDEASFKRVIGMATRATIGVNLDETTVDEETAGDDWEEMMRGGLQTALEDAVIVFAVSGVSRTCTHQLVRSRRAAFHQQSQRASYYGDFPEARMPESVWLNDAARQAWMAAKAASDQAYRVACEAGISYQDARYVLLEGTDNYIMCEYSVREFLAVFDYRGCSMFSWEIVSVMRKMREALLETHPWLEPFVKISCEKTSPSNILTSAGPETFEHKCTFQGWESVEGQCPFSWAKERNRTFQPKLHKIAPREEAKEEQKLTATGTGAWQDAWAKHVLELAPPFDPEKPINDAKVHSCVEWFAREYGYDISTNLVRKLLQAYGWARIEASMKLNVNPNDLVCEHCGRDNRNGTHTALEGMHLNHEFSGITPESYIYKRKATS